MKKHNIIWKKKVAANASPAVFNNCITVFVNIELKVHTKNHPNAQIQKPIIK